MKVLKEHINLSEDIFNDFEKNTYFRQIKDKNGRPYHIPTIYQILRIKGDEALCNVVGHDYSNRFKVSLSYLKKAMELGYFQILTAAEREKLMAKEMSERSRHI